MGRKSLDVKATTVRLKSEHADAIDQKVGKKRRAQFIREAVETALATKPKVLR